MPSASAICKVFWRREGELLLDAPARSVRIDDMFSSREYVFMVVVENEHGFSAMSEPSIPQRNCVSWVY